MGLSAKEELIQYIKSLPDSLTFEEIAYYIYVMEEIRKGQRDPVSYSQKEVEEMVKSNFK